ncbi:MAG: hypothetical protein HY592_02445 [Candidatus Omnitrophica bacterium]|nr:hypothetical protein [Candidatus Omnitrophota bacterium]
MKKTILCLAVAAVLAAGVMGGLSLLPHTHGDDVDHSQHTTCPIHQFGLQGFQAEAVDFQAAPLFFIVAFLFLMGMLSFRSVSHFFHSLRAPPLA